MSRVPGSCGQGLAGGGMLLRLLAAGRELRAVLGSPTRAAEVRAMVDTSGAPTDARASVIAADRDHDAGRVVDGVAGSEFLDDRIRLLD